MLLFYKLKSRTVAAVNLLKSSSAGFMRLPHRVRQPELPLASKHNHNRQSPVHCSHPWNIKTSPVTAHFHFLLFTWSVNVKPSTGLTMLSNHWKIRDTDEAATRWPCSHSTSWLWYKSKENSPGPVMGGIHWWLSDIFLFEGHIGINDRNATWWQFWMMEIQDKDTCFS